MAEIRRLENRHDVIFFCWGWSDLDKILQTSAEWCVDSGDMVKIETRCRLPIWRTFGRFLWHVIPEPPAGCSHLAKSMSWSCHIARCNNSICHIENRFLPYFSFFWFFYVVWALTRGSFRIVSDALVYCLWCYWRRLQYFINVLHHSNLHLF